MSAKRVKTSAEERIFMFSSESVNEGHPDKLADQVSDAVLDACLKEDPYSKERAAPAPSAAAHRPSAAAHRPGLARPAPAPPASPQPGQRRSLPGL